jgi:hypothetical protein
MIVMKKTLLLVAMMLLNIDNVVVDVVGDVNDEDDKYLID